jgi:transcriptional regulator with XRE-family HTH domain
MLTRSQFAAWLQARRDAGETLKAIGERFGVTHVTVAHWLSGKRNPSRMPLVLAGELGSAPVEMAPGLPNAGDQLVGASTHLRGSRSAADYLADTGG